MGFWKASYLLQIRYHLYIRCCNYPFGLSHNMKNGEPVAHLCFITSSSLAQYITTWSEGMIPTNSDLVFSQTPPGSICFLLFHMVFPWITLVLKDGLHTARIIFLTKIDCSFLQALLSLWTPVLHCFSQLFPFLCKLPFNKRIISKYAALKSSGVIWWVQYSPQHLNPLL